MEFEWYDIRPLDVYSLRGGMYRETAWARSPLQPTVITSTVDQVGSRLLFRGYGVSDSMKLVHAGLVGNDSLILLDEAHCAKPFQQTAEAVAQFRDWNESIAPFRFVSITATPATDDDVMRDDVDDLNHAVLGRRIKASKPAKLVVAEKAKGKNFTGELVKALAKQAAELAKEAACVGIIVNRVKTARDLKKALGDDAVLLTGRMRPLDRDRLFEEKLQPLLSNADGTLPKFVIGTQCLEVGADFDFHALLTECASLDALRQRFGRLNRVARRETANAVIIICGDQTEDTSKDPIYGESIAETWKWLKSQAKDDLVDFGIVAIRAAIERSILEGVVLSRLNAPAADAPVLFPAHLDCWVQTNPIPMPDPNPAIFLHGPNQPGQLDVKVVFREDLDTSPTEAWAEIVALCPPSSSEAVAVPISVFKKWLAGTKVDDQSGDVEGGSRENEEDEPLERMGSKTLCWEGTGSAHTHVVSNPDWALPNRTYVVPCRAEGVENLADFYPVSPHDYAEEAFQRSRDKALLRLKDFAVDGDDEEYESKLSDAITDCTKPDSPEWKVRAVNYLANPKNRIVELHPSGGVVVTGRRRLFQFAPEFLDDAASSYSPGRRAVTLDEHSRGVADYAMRFAKGGGLPESLYQQTGLLHDLGKLDPRFQAMLKQGSPRTAVGPPLAKSAKGPRTKQERDEARLVHRYPSGARHELLSAAIVGSVTSDDDLLHLIATHHGSARPFANGVEENDATKPFPVNLFGLTIAQQSPKQTIAEWNAELPERFWRMVRKHGWWGLAYREAVFRLADHEQSRAEQENDIENHPILEAKVELPRKQPKPTLYPLPLTGIDGSNPLAFLAALGTLRLANEKYPGTNLRWDMQGVCRPILELPVEITPADFAQQLHARLHRVVDPVASKTVDDLDKKYRAKRKETEKAMKSIKERKLRGAEREAAVTAEVRPLERVEHQARRAWLCALEGAVPAPFLSLGKSIAVSAGEFKAFADRAYERLHENRQSGRADADFVSALGCEACTDQNERVVPTKLQLITGSGHQFFLETFGSLMEVITVDQVRRSLFGPWTYQDPRLSFRWEPLDDRRYAVSWADPSSSEVRTEHGANLLAAYSLPFFVVSPGLRTAETTGFYEDKEFAYLTWPIWTKPHSVEVIRSFLQSALIHNPKPEAALYHSLGLDQLFRVRKFEVGTPPLSKLNVSMAVVV